MGPNWAVLLHQSPEGPKDFRGPDFRYFLPNSPNLLNQLSLLNRGKHLMMNRPLKRKIEAQAYRFRGKHLMMNRLRPGLL